jgi:hypothetical protein
VHCGNHEVYGRVRGLNPSCQVLWSPGLILDERLFAPAEISVFSFGMAHKIRTDLFRRLRELLDASGRSYTLYVSAANHETTRMHDAQLIFRELHEIFPTLFFLGNLSDVAVFNYLRSSTFFASFFLGGVRANNGSVAAAMEKGAVVITNLDEHSPPELVHMDNVIDVHQCGELPLDPLTLRRISVRAMETGRRRGWDQLVARLAGAAEWHGTGRSRARASLRAARSPGRSRGRRRARAGRGGRRSACAAGPPARGDPRRRRLRRRPSRCPPPLRASGG